MTTTPACRFSLRCLAAALVLVSVSLGADVAKPQAAPASPLSPGDALKHFQLDPTCRIELAAAEPQVVDPVDIRFDEDGRMWVVEMGDYPHGPAKGEPGKCQIKVLEDRDGDGRYETATVFADKLLFVTGLQPWKGGVFVTLAGRVAYMKDTNGDGRADVDETWFTGFAQENSQLRANHPRLALDNHIYVANGLRGGKVVNVRRKEAKGGTSLSKDAKGVEAKTRDVIDISGMDFRFDPLTGEAEAVSGNGQFGLTFDDYGNRFTCTNRNPLIHVVLEQRYLKQNPAVAVPSVVQDVAKSGEESRLFPISRAWTTSNLHAGTFTAACGVEIYRGDALPNEFYGNAFTCDPTGNLVHREIMKPNGATFESQAAYKDREFLASTDEWFRPVNLTVGPDGALYVVDMYRAVIEHPDFVPDELKKRPDLMLGNDRGRIWRIVAKEASGRRRPADGRPQLSKAKGDDLVKLLEHPNAWWRETAQRVLVEQGERAERPALLAMAERGRESTARIHALWTLRGMDDLGSGTIAKAVADRDTRVREQATILAEPWMQAPDLPTEVFQGVVRAYADRTDVRLRLHGLLCMSFIRLEGIDHWRTFDLATEAINGAEDPRLRQAAYIATQGNALALLHGLITVGQWSKRKANDAELRLFGELSEQISLEKTEWPVALQVLSSLPRNETGDRIQRVVLIGLSKALLRKRSSLRLVFNGLDGDKKQELANILRRSRATAEDLSSPETDRVSAIGLLAYAPDSAHVLSKLVADDHSQLVRQSAVVALAQHDDLEPWKDLLNRLKTEPPAMRSAILESALARTVRAELLLDKLAAGRIKPSELDRTHVDRLLRHSDTKIRERAAKLLADAIPADRQKVLADYQIVLKMTGDARRGTEIFKKNCAACHRIGDVGVNVAPDISDSRVKSPAQILTDILQPNRAIDANYVSYSLQTADGRQLTGIIAAETATSVTLKQQEGKIVTLLRSEIERMQSNGVSLMPEGLEKTIPPQEMADLVAFIKNWRYLDGKTPLGK